VVHLVNCRLGLFLLCAWNSQVRTRGVVGILTLCLLLCLIILPCAAQGQDVLCSDGNGSFQSEFQNTGVIVRVGASRNGELAIRKCKGALGWHKQSLAVATNAAQVDLDTFGVDLGLGKPVATFQVKQLDSQCCVEYRVYSLEKPPRLLRTITGGDFFSAADTDLDGRVEIWTDDAAVADGFEGLNLDTLDSAPTIILRFAHGKLSDVSSEFQPYFDRQIAKLRAQLDAVTLREFRNSDGKLSLNAPLSGELLLALRRAKAKVLEIVWCYLYSGREQQAWRSLEEMWPTADAARIRAAILSMRARGISAQVDGISLGRSRKRESASIFDLVSQPPGGQPEVTPPKPILLAVPPMMETLQEHLSGSEAILDLVIDSAGKVRSAEPAGKSTGIDQALIYASAGWKFIPAFKGSRAVACRMRLAVSPRQ
jgi:hypothetical protein